MAFPQCVVTTARSQRLPFYGEEKKEFPGEIIPAGVRNYTALFGLENLPFDFKLYYTVNVNNGVK